jgi:hypothetical protein
LGKDQERGARDGNEGQGDGGVLHIDARWRGIGYRWQRVASGRWPASKTVFHVPVEEIGVDRHECAPVGF